MLILAADTSGKNGNIALVRFDASVQESTAFNRKEHEERTQSPQTTNSHTLDVIPLEGGTFSAQLVPQIAVLLAKNNLSKRDIDAFAVASGPGSFTGLRVGLAAIKALAEILQKPVAAVSLLEVLARSAETNVKVLAALDAGRGEVYAGAYSFKSGGVSCVEERMLSMPELLAASEPVVAYDSKIIDALRAANRPVILVAQPRADAVARLGFEKIKAGETVQPEALDATYIRRSDAEIKFSKPSR